MCGGLEAARVVSVFRGFMAKNNFDRKFGAAFLSTAPLAPGVYRFFNKANEVIYVGKAIKLRRRLSQYRSLSRKKKHDRMRAIVRAAESIAWEETSNHLEACILELRLIQSLRPKLNIVGAYSFLYPFIGVRRLDCQTQFIFTTDLAMTAGFEVFGAFRSRELCAESFFCLMRLLAYVAHREVAIMRRDEKKVKHTHRIAFRALPEKLFALFAAFFSGESIDALRDLALLLLENAGARAKASAVQDDFDVLKRLWQEELRPLRDAISATQYPGAYPLPQAERDVVFAQLREMRSVAG